ncbi:hypothetical protein LXL04_028208 [Taraxacum kok-saghyz]
MCEKAPRCKKIKAYQHLNNKNRDTFGFLPRDTFDFLPLHINDSTFSCPPIHVIPFTINKRQRTRKRHSISKLAFSIHINGSENVERDIILDLSGISLFLNMFERDKGHNTRSNFYALAPLLPPFFITADDFYRSNFFLLEPDDIYLHTGDFIGTLYLCYPSYLLVKAPRCRYRCKTKRYTSLEVSPIRGGIVAAPPNLLMLST